MWLVASYCIFQKSEKTRGGKNKCKSFSFSFFLLLLVSVFCMYISVFLSKRQKKCHIVLNECLYFNLFVVCQNEDLEHVAGVTRWNEKGKKKTSTDSWRFVNFGGFQGLKKKRRMSKGVFLSSGLELRIFTHSLVYYLVPSMMSLPSLPCWSCSESGSRPQQSGHQVPLPHPPDTDLGSVRSCASNLTSKGNVHIWPVIGHSGRLRPALDFEYLSEVLKVEKKKVERSSLDRTGMCNKSYSNSPDWILFF